MSTLAVIGTKWGVKGCGVQVIVAGTSQQVAAALEEAEEFRQPLVERGVLVVPLPIFEGSNAEKDKQNQLNDTDLRYALKWPINNS